MRPNTWAVWLSCVGAVLLAACGAKIVGDGDAGGLDSGTSDSGRVDSGTECRTGELRCDDRCVLVTESREHCGACDNTCEAGEVCSAGTCATSCGGGLTDCEGVCRDLDTNRSHCGACGNACASGQVCVEGACELSCAEGQVICDGSCTDTNSSFENCGSCGNACSDGQVCSLGACALSCASGLTDCSGSCVELPYNVNHCTACDAACGPYANAIPSCNNTCIMTCNEGFEDCNADRVDGCEAELATDEAHCGECGNVCSFANAATECVAGGCVMRECNAGFDDCDGDPANGCECRIAVVGPPGTSPFSGGTIRDLDEDPATGAITPSGMVTDTSRDFLWVVNVNESTVSRWDANMRMEVARYRVGLPAGECAGSVIHALSDEQDMRNMGGIWRKIPFTYAMMWIGSLALAGIPFFAGYYSKDMILEAAYGAHSAVGLFGFWMGIAAAFMTAFYSWRLIIMTFHGKPRMSEEVLHHVHESPLVMTIPLGVLALGAVISGAVAYDTFVGHHMAEFWGASIKVLAENNSIEAAHHAPLWVKLAPLVVGLAGIALAYLMYMFRTELPGMLAARFRPVYLFLLNKWYFDELYDWLFVKRSWQAGLAFWQGGDRAIIDGYGPDGISAVARLVAARAGRLQTGYVYHYAFAMLIGVVALVSWYLAFGA